jgi:tetratricopeptide (TPR) repeat protein
MRATLPARVLLTFGLVGALGLLPARLPVARAEDGWKALVDEGVVHYGARRYDEAVRAFEAAHALRPEPELVYNIARAHEKALRAAEAIAAYERFLATPGTTAALRAKALASLEALRAETEARARAERPREPAPAVAAPVVPPPPVAPGRTLEWTLLGAGAASAVAGAVFGGLALRDHRAFEDLKATGAARAALEPAAARVTRNALVADVLVGAGLLAAAAGGLLLWIDDDGPALAIGPGGVTFAARF